MKKDRPLGHKPMESWFRQAEVVGEGIAEADAAEVVGVLQLPKALE